MRLCTAAACAAAFALLAAPASADTSPPVTPPAARQGAAANAMDGGPYLRAQLAIARGHRDAGRKAELAGSLDRVLSLAAALKTPAPDADLVAQALSEALGLLQDDGQAERAWGIYKAAGGGVAAALPSGSAELATYRLREAQLLAQVGDVAGARGAAGRAVDAVGAADLQPAQRVMLQADALTLRAELALAAGDVSAAQAALAHHPMRTLYATAERTPGTLEEIAYLAVRALTADAAGGSDAVAAAVLSRGLSFTPPPRLAGRVVVYRLAGLAAAAPSGAARDAKLLELGRAIREADRSGDPVWRHPGVREGLLLHLALGAPAAGRNADAAFALFQIAGRAGPSFDADATAALAQARDALQRRTIHQALRLRARRDRLERTQIQRVAERLGERTAPGRLQHDPATRLLIRDFNVRVARAEAELAKVGVNLQPDVVPLARLQAILAPDEAVLAVAPSGVDIAGLCVRRDLATATVTPIDPVKLKFDTRILQASLTADHAPSEALDAQYPVEAAVRLYDAMLRPAEPCLRSGDRIVWLSGVAVPGVPLAALLPTAPPKLAAGYDLAAADWVVRRHTISYAGSAAVLLATRTAASSPDGDLDFLGVGDPRLEAPGAKAAVLRGVRGGLRISDLAPLPETRDELVASARGFRRTQLLTGPDATERSFRSQLVGEYRYLSFATHGLIRDDLQGLTEPALVLTPVAPDDPLDDGLLTAGEIADLDLRARFVALSACNTANFDLQVMAEDLPALASAFSVAGVPAILGTLWPVNSDTGKQVVSGLFERVRAGAAPADALAQAQRAFLETPPRRAYLHPRFWAPFVTLGDGTAVQPPPRPTGLRLDRVELLTRTGGEVLGLQRGPGVQRARLISDADAAGRHGAGVRARSAAGAPLWSREAQGVGAARIFAELGPTVLAGGYALGAHGRYAPNLEAYGAADGAPAGVWRGDGLARVDAFPMAAATLDAQTAVLAVGEMNLRDAPGAGGGRLHVLAVGPDVAPRPLFEAAAPAGSALTDATLTALGDKLVLTYTAEAPRPADGQAALDDYDQPYCAAPRTTWVELRDRTGRLLASQVLADVSVSAATRRGGQVLLGGAWRAPCGEPQATVLALDSKLAASPLYVDETLGASEVRALAPARSGGVLAAASKASVVDYAPDARPAVRADPYALKPFLPTFAGMLIPIPPKGRAGPPRLIESGANIYVSALEASDPTDLWLGGALAGQAAVFHLAAPQ